MVLIRRSCCCAADLKIAIPTSVVMAFTSVIGIAFKNMFTGVQPGVYENWWRRRRRGARRSAGAFAVELIGRKPTLLFVAVLRVGQFV